MADDDTLGALKRHNDELAKLLTPEGLRELDRMALLESAVVSFSAARSEYWQSVSRDNPEEVTNRLHLAISEGQTGGDTVPDADHLSGLSGYIGGLRDIGDAAKNLTKKVGSVANSYVKKKVGDIIGGDDA